MNCYDYFEAPTEALDPTEAPTEALDPTEAPTEALDPTDAPTEALDPVEALVYADLEQYYTEVLDRLDEQCTTSKELVAVGGYIALLMVIIIAFNFMRGLKK